MMTLMDIMLLNIYKNHKKIVSNFIQNKKFPNRLLINNHDY